MSKAIMWATFDALNIIWGKKNGAKIDKTKCWYSVIRMSMQTMLILNKAAATKRTRSRQKYKEHTVHAVSIRSHCQRGNS